jgi:hypothetical protein
MTNSDLFKQAIAALVVFLCLGPIGLLAVLLIWWIIAKAQ